MKRVFIPFLAMVISLGLVLPLVTPAAPGDHYKGQIKGMGAEAWWSLYDEVSGVYTDILVYTSDKVYKNPLDSPEARAYGEIDIWQYRYVDDEYVPIRDVYFWGDVPAGSIVVDRTLSSASLILSGVEGEIYDHATESSTPVLLDIDLRWSAIAPITLDSYRSHNRYPDGFAYYFSRGKSREAETFGVVSFEDTSIPLEFAQRATILSSRTGTVEVYR